MADFDEDVEQDFDELDETPEDEVELEEDEAVEQTEEADDEPAEQTTEEASDDSGDDEEEFDKPVSEGETVELEIEDLGSKGDGIARVEGFVVFVPGGEVGESYDVEITSVGRKFAFGEIE
jgi:predicted RNA-binding protein with TRAM domain